MLEGAEYAYGTFQELYGTRGPLYGPFGRAETAEAHESLAAFLEEARGEIKKQAGSQSARHDRAGVLAALGTPALFLRLGSRRAERAPRLGGAPHRYEKVPIHEGGPHG